MSTQEELKFKLSAEAEQAVAEMNKTAEAINRTTEAMRQLGGASSGADQTGRAMTGAAGAANGAANAMGQTGRATDQAGRQMAEAAREAERLGDSLRRLQNTRPLDAARDIIGVRSFATIQREIDLVTAAYNRLARSGKLSEQELAVANQATQASVARLRAEMQTLEQAHKSAGLSAGQHAAAMRMLPVQMTDVAVSLASGMPVWMVAIQQGGQLKDAFGGVGAMARAVGGYVAGLANPFLLTAAAGTVLFTAFEAGRAEAAALNNALAMTGGASGQTIDDLMGMAAAIDQVAGTQGKAAEVIGMLVNSGKVGADGIQQFATAVILAERNMGIEAEQTVAKFAELGKSPVDAVKRLNDGMNFLTAATYAEIKALQDQGRTADAAALAQRAYADALESRAKTAAENVGLLERAWKGIKSAAAEAWDAMLDIGRPDSLEKKIADAQKRVAEQRQLVARGGRKGLFGESVGGGLDGAKEELAQFEAEAAALVAQRKAQTDAAAKAASDAKTNAAGVAARDYLDKLQGQSDRVGALQSELAEYRRNVAAAAAAGQAVSAADQARDEKFIRDKYADKSSKPADQMPEAQRRLAEAQAKAASESLMRLLDLEQQQLDARRAQGLLSLEQHEQQKADIQKRRLDQEEALINRRIEIESGRKVKDAADGVTQQATLVDLNAQRNRVRDQRADLPTATLSGQQSRAVSEAQQRAQEWAAAWSGAVDKVRQLEQEAATSAALVITDPLARARAEAEITARATERAAAETLVSLRAQIDVLRGQGMAQEAGMLAEEAQRIEAAAAAKAQGQRQAPGLKAATDFINAEVKIDIGDGFGAASQSMSALVKSFEQLNEQQRLYNDAKAAEGLTAEQVAQIEGKHVRSQIAGYASVAGAAKGLLKEKTAGYRILDSLEKASRAYEVASAIKTSAVKMGLISAETGAKLAGYADVAISAVKAAGTEIAALFGIGSASAAVGVANQAQGDPYTALPRMAAMAAAMAALGFAVSGGKGGGGGVAPKNTGTGTVLGDKDAQSESLANSIAELTKVDRLTMEYSAGMLASLRNIESSIAGVGSLIARGGAFSSVVSGITEGKSGGISFLGGLFGTKTTINAQGLQAGPQTLAQILDSGTLDAQFFAEVTKKKTLRRAKTSTTVTDADATTESQLGMVFRDIAGSLSSAAGALGAPLADVENRIRGFTVNLGKIDLKGLSGKEIGERLSAVIGAESDRIAEAALPGLQAWQKVGEGYYQTAIRVASGVEEAGSRLRRLGVAAVSLADVANTQGDAAAEIVRDSILQSEVGLRAGLSEIIETLDGSAEQIADTFGTLRDARRSLELFGLGAADVTRSMIDAAGGLDELASGLSDYESSILSETEQQAAKTGRLADEFKRLGVAMPTTKAQFKALVESASKDTTEAGQRLLGGLLPLSSAFAEIAESVTDAGSALDDEIKRIRGLISDETATTASLQAQFALKTAQARAGDSAALEALPELSKALLDKAAETAGSRAELVREQAAVAASLEATRALTRGQAVTSTSTETTQAAETAATVAVQTATTEAATAQPAAQAATTLQPADIEALRAELAEVGRRIAALTDQQQSIGLSIADSAGRTARVLERVTPDGDAIATRAAA